ncbi:MAG: hypothetical protein AAFO84_16695, partial [Cyanobacteria bacterium J06598_1]
EFSAARLDHWLLVCSFVSVAGWGLWLCWRWRNEAVIRRRRIRLTRRWSGAVWRAQGDSLALKAQASESLKVNTGLVELDLVAMRRSSLGSRSSAKRDLR